jgi:hypothetical protein
MNGLADAAKDALVAIGAYRSAEVPGAVGQVRFDDLRVLEWDGWGFEARIGVFWLLVLAAGVVLFFLVRSRMRGLLRSLFRTKRLTLKFLGTEWEIVPDTETRRVAYQAWVECLTRKVGLPFEEDKDVIVEVYDSWYKLFSILRELAKSVPPERLRDGGDAEKLVVVLMAALNQGLRPHLTNWQARFRRWYGKACELAENSGRSPQQIQRTYPQYNELVTDLKAVNGEFVKFAERLIDIVNAQ